MPAHDAPCSATTHGSGPGALAPADLPTADACAERATTVASARVHRAGGLARHVRGSEHTGYTTEIKWPITPVPHPQVTSTKPAEQLQSRRAHHFDTARKAIRRRQGHGSCVDASLQREWCSAHRTIGRQAYPPRNRCSFGMPVLASSFCSSNSRPTDCRRRLVALSPPAGGRHTTGATLPPAAAFIKRRLAGAATDLQQTVVLKRNLQLLHAYRQSPGASLHLPARRNALSKLGS